MKLVFVSNYFNHHQKPISDCFYNLLDGQYWFIETSKMSEERKSLGYTEMSAPYVLSYESNLDECLEKIQAADVVIFGGADGKYIKKFHLKDKICFACSERLLKHSNSLKEFLPRALKWNYYWCGCKNKFLLCSSAYAAKDYNSMGLFRGKAYKWGYFPKAVKYIDIKKMIDSKKHNSILWVGRFIDWKHPEIPIELAKRLTDAEIKFEMNLIGNGEMVETIKNLISINKLNNNVHLLGAMSTEDVRKYMECSEIFLFTSDRNEGWGAVLNEAMNSACAVIADRNIGSVPYLIAEGENGFYYENIDNCYNKLLLLINNQNKRKSISAEAYYTIINEWNANIAAERFLKLYKHIFEKDESAIFTTGPCSVDERIGDI